MVDYTSVLFGGSSTLRQTANLRSRKRLGRNSGAIGFLRSQWTTPLSCTYFRVVGTCQMLLLFVAQDRRCRAVGLFALEDEGDRLAVRFYDADQHGAMSGKGVAFESNRSGLGGGHP
jgi:hypothetical protein